MDYRVELDVFNGPMDLLLYLIKRDELDIYDIPISRITDSYVKYLAELRQMKQWHGLDINIAGDFLVMAATLMEIKSATLLPKPPAETSDGSNAMAELVDPRMELVQKLLEYKKFKDAAMMLDRQHLDVQNRFPRKPARLEGDSDDPPPLDLDEVQIWDLLDSFTRLMQELGVRGPGVHEVTYDDTPIDLHAADIEDRLKREGSLTLRQLLVGRKNRSEMIGVFLALLELIREKRILVTQHEVQGEIEIVEAPEEHKRTFSHASLHLATEAPDDSLASEDEEQPVESISQSLADAATEPHVPTRPEDQS